MQGVSLAGGVNAGMQVQNTPKQAATEGSREEEARESAAQETMEDAKKVAATDQKASPSPAGVGKGVDLFA